MRFTSAQWKFFLCSIALIFTVDLLVYTSSKADPIATEATTEEVTEEVTEATTDEAEISGEDESQVKDESDKIGEFTIGANADPDDDLDDEDWEVIDYFGVTPKEYRSMLTSSCTWDIGTPTLVWEGVMGRATFNIPYANCTSGSGTGCEALVSAFIVYRWETISPNNNGWVNRYIGTLPLFSAKNCGTSSLPNGGTVYHPTICRTDKVGFNPNIMKKERWHCLRYFVYKQSDWDAGNYGNYLTTSAGWVYEIPWNYGGCQSPIITDPLAPVLVPYEPRYSPLPTDPIMVTPVYDPFWGIIVDVPPLQDWPLPVVMDKIERLLLSKN